MNAAISGLPSTVSGLSHTLLTIVMDGATLVVGSLLLAGRRSAAQARLSCLSEAQLRDIGLRRQDVMPYSHVLQSEIMRHELGRW